MSVAKLYEIAWRISQTLRDPANYETVEPAVWEKGLRAVEMTFKRALRQCKEMERAKRDSEIRVETLRIVLLALLTALRNGKPEAADFFREDLAEAMPPVLALVYQLAPESDSPDPRQTLPRWNRIDGILTVPGRGSVTFGTEAPRQFAVLDLLERAGWPAAGVAVPDDMLGVKDACDALNVKLTSLAIRVLSQKGGQRVRWRRDPL
jgi:hypothetical protein